MTVIVPLPGALLANPLLSQWIEVTDAGVRIKTGKVELGQGAVTGIAVLAAAQLGLSPGEIDVVAGSTIHAPDEGYTVGSMSIEEGGAAMRWAAAAARMLFRKAAATRLGLSEMDVRFAEGGFSSQQSNEILSYADLRRDVNLSVRFDALPAPDFIDEDTAGSDAAARLDLPQKLAGAAFIQDIDFPGLHYGRVLRPEHPHARLVDVDIARVEAMPGVVSVVVDGRFVGVVATRMEIAANAVARLRGSATWRVVRELGDAPDRPDWLEARDPVGTFEIARDADVADRALSVRVSASYSRPYLAHASIGPSTAIAIWNDGRVRVISHTQGVYPLRDALARALRVPLDHVEVEHAMGAGCYGHNGSDDVALDAALLARASGVPVMCAMSRQDELCWSPFGAAMRVNVEAGLDDQSRISFWKADIFSTPHVARPGAKERGINLLAASEIADPHPVDRPVQLTGPAGTGDRNATPLYRIAGRDIRFHLLPQGPLRSSSLRSLGAHCNVFAIESMMDELAARAAIDPVAFRLAHLDDARARHVVERVAELSGWQSRQAPGSGSGLGLGFARYKNRNAYCAIAVALSVDNTVKLDQVHAVVDCGTPVHRDGALNQIEGGIVQAASWTLKEQVSWNRDGFVNKTWDSYPILGFAECPPMTIELVDRPGAPPLGVGECAAGPTAAAIGNAVAHALGVRVRDMPISRERIMRAIEEFSE